MSEETPTPPKQEGDASGPQMRQLTQYIKDLSFENPNAPASLQNGPTPEIEMEIGVGAQSAQENIYEVSLSISVKATRDDKTVFLIELVFCGLFALEGFPEEALGPVLHIECTRMLFPFARRIVSDLTQDGGFPALPMDPIDFAAVYRAGLEQQAAQKANGGDEVVGNA